MAGRERFPLPRGWTRTVRSSVLHAVSIASTSLTSAWSRAAGDRRPRVRMVVELERAKTEIALLREELSIKDARWSRVPPRRRPYYEPIQRMRILKLRAARSWATSQVGRVFLVTEETMAVGSRNRFPLDGVGVRTHRTRAFRHTVALFQPVSVDQKNRECFEASNDCSTITPPAEGSLWRW